MSKLIKRLNKNADIARNRIVIPKKITDLWGRNFYMEIYEDRIVLIPTKLGRK